MLCDGNRTQKIDIVEELQLSASGATRHTTFPGNMRREGDKSRKELITDISRNTMQLFARMHGKPN